MIYEKLFLDFDIKKLAIKSFDIWKWNEPDSILTQNYLKSAEDTGSSFKIECYYVQFAWP